VREFADQAESAARARTRLAVLQRPVAADDGALARLIWAEVDDTEYGPIGVSADGRYVSFTDGSSGDLAVRDLRDGTTRRLTHRGSWAAGFDFATGKDGWAAESLVSPDGRRVAYGWHHEYPGEFQGSTEIRVLPLSGEPGEPRIVHRSRETGYILPVGWTPDGTSLLVLRRLQDLTGQIAFISIADGSLRVLKSLEWRWPSRVRLSADGRFIAYDAPAAADVPAKDIFLLAADGSRETVAVQNPANDHHPVWSPDGSQLLFVSNRTRVDSLWTVPIVAGNPTGSPELVKPDIGPLLGMTRSGALYYVSQGQKRNIYTVDVDADLKATSAPVLATTRIDSNSAPAWSRDGGSMAYYSGLRPSTHPGPGSLAIGIRSLKTGEEREVISGLNVSDRLRMRWFPDGRSLLVPSHDPQNRTGYYRLDTTSGTVERLFNLPTSGLEEHVDLAPDGRSIFYIDKTQAQFKSRKLMRFDLDSRRATEVIRVGPSATTELIAVAVSPDGTQLALRDWEGWLAVVSTGGREPRRVFRIADDNGSHGTKIDLAWTPNQRYLLFAKCDTTRACTPLDHVHELWRVALATGEVEKIGISAKGMIKFASVDPGGHRIAYQVAGVRTSELWSLENFRSPLTPTK
jgi:Tol biopolymer transport system component